MLASLLFALGATASPILIPRELKEYTADIEIHSSCNATQTRMLKQALGEMNEVASFAIEYLEHNGAQDEVFTTYFGTEPEAYPTVLGAYKALLGSNKKGALFRCDDPDGNCHQDGWRGHYRGENATTETVICDASYTDRLYNSAFCMFGFQLARDKPSVYWSIDLMHRMFHVPQVTNEAVGHVTEGLADLTDKAAHNSTGLDLDSDALQYFAAHVYAVEVAGGGDECIGEIGHDHDDAHGDDSQGGDKDCHTHADGTVHCVGGDAHQDPQPSSAQPVPESTSEAAPEPTSEAAPEPTSEAAPEPTSEAAQAAPSDNCHTHADGTVHCGDHDEAAAAPAPAQSDNCHTHADGTVHCGDHDEPAAPAPSAADAGKDCHTHADGTVHCV